MDAEMTVRAGQSEVWSGDLLLVHQSKHKSASDFAQLLPKLFNLFNLVGHPELGPQALMLWRFHDSLDVKSGNDGLECLIDIV